jgi:hypothetical protein
MPHVYRHLRCSAHALDRHLRSGSRYRSNSNARTSPYALAERGYRGSPSSGMGSQGAAESTNCRYEGRIPGSRSRVPSRTTTC